jgi:hypothetical protein
MYPIGAKAAPAAPHSAFHHRADRASKPRLCWLSGQSSPLGTTFAIAHGDARRRRSSGGEILEVKLPRPKKRIELAHDPVFADCRAAVLDFLYRKQLKHAA